MGFGSHGNGIVQAGSLLELPAAKQLVAESDAETCRLLKERGLTTKYSGVAMAL